MAFIKLDYEMAREQAEKLKNAGELGVRTAENLNKLRIGLSSCWNSGAATELDQKLLVLAASYSVLSNSLKDIADEINSVAGKIKSADESVKKDGGGRSH